MEESSCGWVVPPDDPAAIADKIQKLYQDPALRSRLGARGRQLFEAEFNWEKHEGQLVELYRRILAK